ncbi:hypothetical protein ACLKA6_000733 [Drosophila palustris]
MQQFTPNKGNSNYNKSKQPTYSQVARAGNVIKPREQSASGPASRHLSAFQAKLRAEQEQKEKKKNMQPAQESHGQHLQPDDCLSLAIKQNTHTIALMGQKMDAMLEIIRDMLSRLLPTTPQQTPQQRPTHIEPIVRIASPNPNDMSVDTIESNSQNKYANENRNE